MTKKLNNDKKKLLAFVSWLWNEEYYNIVFQL
jgi:hypothetical protein